MLLPGVPLVLLLALALALALALLLVSPGVVARLSLVML